MSLGPGELLLVLVLALIVFGPDRLPQIGKNLGRALRSFRSASADLQDGLRASLQVEDNSGKDGGHARPAAASSRGRPLPPPPEPEPPPPVSED